MRDERLDATCVAWKSFDRNLDSVLARTEVTIGSNRWVAVGTRLCSPSVSRRRWECVAQGLRLGPITWATDGRILVIRHPAGVDLPDDAPEPPATDDWVYVGPATLLVAQEIARSRCLPRFARTELLDLATQPDAWVYVAVTRLDPEVPFCTGCGAPVRIGPGHRDAHPPVDGGGLVDVRHGPECPVWDVTWEEGVPIAPEGYGVEIDLAAGLTGRWVVDAECMIRMGGSHGGKED